MTIAAQQIPRADQSPCVKVSFSLIGKQLPADHGYLVYSAIARVTQRGSSPTVREGSGSTDVSSVSPLHKADWLAIELVSGFASGRGLIALPERGASLHLRIPSEHYRDLLPLAGKRLDIGGHQIRLGLPVARPLEPAPSLYARVVTIKKFTEAEPFLEAVKRKLDQFGVKGRVELPREELRPAALNRDGTNTRLHDKTLHGQRDLSVPPAVAGGSSNQDAQGRYRRRIVTIHGKAVVGFSVAVHDLNDEDSLLLQAGAVKVVSSEDGTTKWQSIFSRRAMGCGIFNPIVREYSDQRRIKDGSNG